MKNRIALAEHFFHKGFIIGAEIGVLGGGYSLELCKANPDLALYCIDSWGINEKRHKEYHERKYDEAHIRLKDYKKVNFIMGLSLEVVRDFIDGYFDFVYIDANHNFDHIMRDLIEWSAKVREGGIVSGHDYTDGSQVKEAVDIYVRMHKLTLEVTKETDKGHRSWFFTKL